MKFRYNVRSSFLHDIAENLRIKTSDLLAGRKVVTIFDDGGYENTAVVTIDPHNSTEFEADLEISDETRFPARIRAAATALRNCKFAGRFSIEHTTGMVIIKKI